MDIRDFSAWAREAVRRAILRRSDLYSASLLPNQREDAMRRTLDDLALQMYELDHEDAIKNVDEMARRRLEEMRQRRRGAK